MRAMMQLQDRSADASQHVVWLVRFIPRIGGSFAMVVMVGLWQCYRCRQHPRPTRKEPFVMRGCHEDGAIHDGNCRNIRAFEAAADGTATFGNLWGRCWCTWGVACIVVINGPHRFHAVDHIVFFGVARCSPVGGRVAPQRSWSSMIPFVQPHSEHA